MKSAENKTVLIVDDEAFLVRALKDRLVREGFAVDSAANGEEGLDKAFAAIPDIILLDLVMPKMDGATMLKALRADPRGREVPVVILSNLNNAQLIDQSLAGGAQEFLIKVNNSLDDVTRIVRRRLGI
jgi:CheY-like chemotaxis protein